MKLYQTENQRLEGKQCIFFFNFADMNFVVCFPGTLRVGLLM